MLCVNLKQILEIWEFPNSQSQHLIDTQTVRMKGTTTLQATVWSETSWSVPSFPEITRSSVRCRLCGVISGLKRLFWAFSASTWLPHGLLRAFPQPECRILLSTFQQRFHKGVMKACKCGGHYYSLGMYGVTVYSIPRSSILLV